MANQERQWWEVLPLREPFETKSKQCVKIKIRVKGNHPIVISVKKVKRGDCICWQSNKEPWSVDFPWETPFESGKSHFDQGDACGDIREDAEITDFKYDVTAGGGTVDPWLDVGT